MGQVVRGLVTHGAVFVVDDGSSDATATRARAAGATVLSVGTNLGYDMALAAGLSRVKALGFKFAVTCDADGQHLTPDVVRVASLLLVEGKAVVGVRSGYARWSEKVFASYSSKIHGLRDPLCGLKAYPLSDDSINFERELLGTIGTGLALAFARFGDVANLPIVDAPRLNGYPKFGSRLRANFRIFRALLMCIAKDLRLRLVICRGKQRGAA